MKKRTVLIAILLVGIAIALAVVRDNARRVNERDHLMSMLEGHPVNPLKRLEIVDHVAPDFLEGSVFIDDSMSINYLQNLRGSSERPTIPPGIETNNYAYFVFEDGTRVWVNLAFFSIVHPDNLSEKRGFFFISYPLDEFGDAEHYEFKLTDPVPPILANVIEALVAGKSPAR